MSEQGQKYSNIRECIGQIIGKKLIDATQHTKQEFDETGEAYFELHFCNGETLRVTFIGECGQCGFSTYKPDEIEN